MKNSKSILLMAATALLISSCGSLSITQKRYSRGLNIDWFSGADDKGVESKKAAPGKKKPATQTVAAADEPVLTPETVGVSEEPVFVAEAAALAPETGESAVVPAEKRVHAKNREVKKDNAFRSAKQELKKKMFSRPFGLKKKSETSATHESDVNMLILVLLALFIPPLAIFLYFGELEVHFLINLILVLLGGGLWLASGGISYFGLAVVHALLVIFGIFG